MKFGLSTIALFFVLTVFTSCTDNNDKNSDYGRLSVNLTDAPFPHDLVAEANVTIFKVEARYKGEAGMTSEVGDNTTESAMGAEEESSFIVLMENEVEVNLLDLTNGVTQNLADLEVPVGTYDLVRVYVRGVNIVLTDGTTFDLKVPSGEQTGIKVFIEPGLVVNGGLSADLLLDFDVSKSFVAKGGSNFGNITGFNFKPVIKASNLSTAGTLAGTVTTLQEEVAVGLEGAQVAVFAADTLNTTTFTDADGKYMVMGLLAGTYDVEVELSTYQKQSVTDIEIVAGNKTSQDFVLSAEAGE